MIKDVYELTLVIEVIFKKNQLLSRNLFKAVATLTIKLYCIWFTIHQCYYINKD